MIDGHVHIERGPYKIEWIKEFVDKASSRGIQTLHLLEHTHRFYEFIDLYSEAVKYNEYQREWLSKKVEISLVDYINLIDEVKSHHWPIDLKFGLETCYFEGKEKLIKEIKGAYDWDFLTGSVHWIDGWGFDHKAEFWDNKNADEAYQRYYSMMMNLVKSNLFDILAHPDSIKCFGHRCSKDLIETYKELAQLIKSSNMKVEQSAGLFLNYKHNELGMNNSLLDVMKEYGAEIITASDAHRPEDVGAYVAEMQHLMKLS